MRRTGFLRRGMRVVAWGLAAGAPMMALAELPQTHVITFEDQSTAGSVQTEKNGGVCGTFGRLDSKRPAATLSLPLEIDSDFILAAWVKVAGSPEGKAGPLSLVQVLDANRQGLIDLRLQREALELAVATSSTNWGSLRSTTAMPKGRWVHVAAVHEGVRYRLYVDGKLQAEKRLDMPWKPGVSLQIGGPRCLEGAAIDEIVTACQALNQAEIEKLAAQPQAGRSLRMAAWRPSPHPPMQYAENMLRLADDVAAPVESCWGTFVPVPWSGRGALDLLVDESPKGFNPQQRLFRNLRVEKRGGDKTFWVEAGMSLSQQYAGTVVSAQSAQPIWRDDGLFDLIAREPSSPFGEQNLMYYRNEGTAGQPRFAAPRPVRCDGRAYTSANGGAGHPTFADIDGDGVPDLLFFQTRLSSNYYPDGAKKFWVDEPLKYAGPGRGYSINGKWLGGDSVLTLKWAKGARDEEGRLSFGAAQEVIYGEQDFPVEWRGYFGAVTTWCKIGGRSYVVTIGDLDNVLCMPARLDQGMLRCGPAVALLEGGARLEHMYIPHTITALDIDGDGSDEILVSGNPGSLSILSGERAGAYREHPVMARGGPLQMQLLTVPCRADWDGDGKADIIAGDASGWLMFFKGSSDPRVYASAEYFTLGGRRIHHQAGYAGSIQGPNEARWGYLNPTVGDWDGDGSPDIITCDITGKFVFYKKTAGLELSAHPLTMNGAPLHGAWRQRPAILPGQFKLAGDDRPTLLVLDGEGDLAAAVPKVKGGTEIQSLRKLKYADGRSMHLCGPSGGLWGRTKFAVADWDRDGRWDLLVGSHAMLMKYIDPRWPAGYKKIQPIVLRNVGTASEPVFEAASLIFYDGKPLEFTHHVAAVWPTDLNGDGLEDVIVGSDDGRIYAFDRRRLADEKELAGKADARATVKN